MQKPEQLQQFNLDELLLQCEQYMNDIESGELHEDGQSDLQHYIFEAAMKAFYGPDVFDWINSKLR
jgi:hypothetical protein